MLNEQQVRNIVEEFFREQKLYNFMEFYSPEHDIFQRTHRNIPWEALIDVPEDFNPSAHIHDERYYTESEIDAFFEGESAGKKQVHWDRITSKPSTFTPSAHAASHRLGGGDLIKLDDFGTPDDNTDLNATTIRHGLLIKLGGGTTNFLREDGTWAEPPGGGGASTFLELTDTPSSYTGQGGKFAKVNATPDALIFENIVWADVSKAGSNLTDLATRQHAGLMGVFADQHHAQLHASAHHVGGGDLINHDSLTGFVAAEHLSLPDIIDNVLSNHTKEIHDGLAIDHGSLGGKGDDDHTQYHNNTRGDLRYYTHAEVENLLALQDEVAEMTDVTGTLNDGDILIWNNSLQKFEFLPPPAAGDHAETHEDGGGDDVGHDLLYGWTANKHIDHTNVSMIAGSGLSGGGTIAANRTFNLGLLTAAWDAGSYQIRALKFYSDQATGVAPFTVLSTTKVNNLNADLLEGYHAASPSTANTVVLRNGSGDINARLFRSEYDTLNPTCNYIMTQIDTASNNYLRPSSKAQLIASLALMTLAGGIFTGNVFAADHGGAATDMIVNVCYGTGNPPTANTTTIGTLFIKYS